MEILKFQDIEVVEYFLNSLFSNYLLETNEFNNSFINNLEIHKKLINEYESVLPELALIGGSLLKNSNLKIDLTNNNLLLFTIAGLSVCVMTDAKFLLDNDIIKSEYEAELKSILEELKLNGIGNGLVKNFSNFLGSILSISLKIYQKKDIIDVLKQKNLLQSVNLYVDKYKLSLDNYVKNLEKLSKLLTVYLKSGKFDELKNKLSKKSGELKSKKVLFINEFNM